MLTHPLNDGAHLGPLEPWQAEAFAAHVEKERAHLAPWLPWATAITDAGRARELLQRYADLQARDAGRLLGVWQDGELIGGTLFRVFDTRTGVCELGVWLAAGAQGRGLVTGAARHMIDWAFRARGMARVEWLADVSNARSQAVAERLGMTHEGVLRQAFGFADRRVDLAVWSLLASEWPGAAPA
jgi:ribosomal-protein-serine acetyltransferase